MYVKALAVAAMLSGNAAAQDPRGHVDPDNPDQAGFAEYFQLSPVIRAGDTVHISGMAAALPPDTEPSPEAYEAAIRRVFEEIGAGLALAGADWSDVVDMTSYHVDMRAHQDIFLRVRREFITQQPYAAWTAVGVEQLWVDSLFVEIDVVAYLGGDNAE